MKHGNELSRRVAPKCDRAAAAADAAVEEEEEEEEVELFRILNTKLRVE